MQFTTNIVLVSSLLLSSALAAPQPEKRSFKVERIPNSKFVAHDGTKQLIKSYTKWNMPLPPALVAKIAADKAMAEMAAATGETAKATSNSTTTTGNSTTGGQQTGSVSATPEAGDIEYLSPVMIGGQTLNLDFDSGSSDLWIFSTKLAAASTAGHTPYDPTKSTTFKEMTGAKWSISYGDGSGAAGTVGTDTVNIGGATVTNQAIELATAVSASFVMDTQSNGLVGLAYSKLNTIKPTQQKTFLDNAIPSLPMPLFTANLKANVAGAYEFGKIDTAAYSGNLNWAAVNTTNGFWQFSSTKFSVDGVMMTIADGTAIADTGTTLMLAAPAIVNAYYSKVAGATNDAQAGGVTFPCASKMPDLAVDMGGNYMAVVPGKFISFAKIDAAGTTCFGGLQATTSPLQIYGDILFKAQFVVFNGGNNSIAMAPHA